MNKKELGAFYTPSHTVRYMLGLLSGFHSSSRLLEPCGGDGAFVSGILSRRLLKPDQVTVWDINPDVGDGIRKLGAHFTVKDTLLETPLGDRDSVIFTHIVGNPPYLNKQSAYIKKHKIELRNIYRDIGVNDTYALFLYLCCHLLAENGQLCFITSDTYLTLGIHRKLRRYLLGDMTINNITLCPPDLFRQTGTLVKTCIIKLTRRKPGRDSSITVNDCRDLPAGRYDGEIKNVRQAKLLDYPDCVFDFNGQDNLIRILKTADRLVNHLDGGLGMHTTDNKKYLGVVDYNGVRFAKGGGTVVPVETVRTGGWKFYHKLGGDAKYYLPAESCIRWDRASVKKYKMPKYIGLGEKRRGFLISGVCSELSARIATPGAYWESNKAMCYFPKDPSRYPPEFFVGILNSDVYNRFLKILNHTNSVQVRDIQKLPFFKFSARDMKQIATLAGRIIRKMKSDIRYDYKNHQENINSILKKYV